jgi:hypothetical protein
VTKVADAVWRDVSLVDTMAKTAEYRDRGLREATVDIGDGAIETTFLFELPTEHLAVPVYRITTQRGGAYRVQLNAVLFPLTTDIDS